MIILGTELKVSSRSTCYKIRCIVLAQGVGEGLLSTATGNLLISHFAEAAGAERFSTKFMYVRQSYGTLLAATW